MRRRSGADDRSRRLEITDPARYLLTRIDGPLERVEAELLGDLTAEEAEALRGLLQRVGAHATDDEAWLPGRDGESAARQLGVAARSSVRFSGIGRGPEPPETSTSNESVASPHLPPPERKAHPAPARTSGSTPSLPARRRSRAATASVQPESV
ncbi:hypothetical protein [Streptomyces sp. NPDC058335]|uniref:hypothetical protein n=1 Tax=Streptomyces sp. NPDC058335 TaxID=3346451 RepID=UPI00365AAD39